MCSCVPGASTGGPLDTETGRTRGFGGRCHQELRAVCCAGPPRQPDAEVTQEAVRGGREMRHRRIAEAAGEGLEGGNARSHRHEYALRDPPLAAFVCGCDQTRTGDLTDRDARVA